MRASVSGVRKFRVQRRLNCDLPGLGRPGALERRPFAPGQHGSARKKMSEYGLRLFEKQKLLAHYQLSEQQLQRFVKNARQAETNWISELSRRLELRLDNIIFRGQFATSIRAARQMVRHGHVLLNGKKANIGSILLGVGDEISVRESSKEHPSVLQGQSSPRLDLPAFIEKSEPLKAKIVAEPTTADVPFAYADRLIAEYYATRGKK